jgi:hypothetical protein
MASKSGPNRRRFLVAATVGTAAGLTPFVTDYSDALGAPAISPTPTDKEEVNDFLVLSRQLTGFDNLDTRLAGEYLQRFQADYGQEGRDNLAKIMQLRAQGASLKDIFRDGKNNDLWESAEQIIYLWYVSAFFTAEDPGEQHPIAAAEAPKTAAAPNPPPPWKYGTLGQFEKSLAWTAIGAHTPMTIGGPTGYWRSKPKGV